MDKIIAPCALVCSECEGYRATQANDAEWIARVAAKMSQDFGEDIRPESIWCDGCLTEGVRKCGYTASCAIRACAVSRRADNCAHCADYRCDRLAGFHDRVPAARETLDAVRLESPR
jgi:hypothetical protein